LICIFFAEDNTGKRSRQWAWSSTASLNWKRREVFF
jgi:hypothetical protein